MDNLFNKEKILKMKKSKESQMINLINNVFKIKFKAIIKRRLTNYKGLPLTWEDVYYEFLYETPKHIKKYNINKKVPFENFISLQCNFFASNKCRSFNSNKHKILNNYSRLIAEDFNFGTNYSTEMYISIDLSLLNELEKIIYKHLFLYNWNVKNTSSELNISAYTIRKKIDSIKLKLLNQIEN